MSNQTQGTAALKAIIHNYLETEKSLVSQLNFQLPDHPPTIGGFREEIWKQLFEQIVPKKYVIEQSVFLMDSQGKVSNEVDLAIFDEMYTPYIFRNGRIKFIPIEAVAAVVQCKSKSLECDDLVDWCKHINDLHTVSNATARLATSVVTPETPNPTQKATRPIKILCHLGNTPQSSKKSYISDELFDFELIADNDQKRITVLYPEGKTLFEWFNELNNRQDTNDDMKQEASESEELKRNPIEEFSKSTVAKNNLDEYRVTSTNPKKSGVSLLSFNLQFNQLLMLINNPMLFPHIAYAKRFCEVYESMPEEDAPKK